MKKIVPMLLLAVSISAADKEPTLLEKITLMRDVLDAATPRSYHLHDPNEPVRSNPNKAYLPGFYGRTKTAPMFIVWREWDGEIRQVGTNYFTLKNLGIMPKVNNAVRIVAATANQSQPVNADHNDSDINYKKDEFMLRFMGCCMLATFLMTAIIVVLQARSQ